MNTTRSAAESLLAVLPITAVESFELAGRNILLIGSGTSIRVVDAELRVALYNSQVLLHQAIHGIIILSYLETDDGRAKLDVIVYGGKQVAWIALDVSVHDEIPICSSFNLVDTVVAEDWILCCKKSDNSELTVSFITSYNALYLVDVNPLTQKLRCQLLTDVVGVFLYSADLIQTHEKGYLIASGTVFGQVLAWSCTLDDRGQGWSVSRCVQFNGHNGSIFGVNISKPRLLDGKARYHIISCSDDRMIQVWDLPSVDFGISISDPAVSDSFAQCDQAFAKTYGHISRIWNVSFTVNLSSSRNDSLVISTGEDGQVQAWLLNTNGQPETQLPVFRNTYIDRHHSGKNIWAQCYSTRNSTVRFITGGADGQIVSREYDDSGRADVSSRHGSQLFKVIRSIIFEETSLKKSSLSLRGYVDLGCGYIMATTDAGQLLRGNMKKDPMEWESVAQDPKGIPLLMSTTMVLGHAFFVRTSDCTLCAINYLEPRPTEICSVRQAKMSNIWTLDCLGHNMNCDFNACIAICYYGFDHMELHWMNMNQGKIGKFGQSSILLPTTFEATSVLYDQDLQVLICGSRAGTIVVSANISTTTTNTATELSNHHIHGHDTVTSICKLDGDPQSRRSSFYLSTGADGTYCIHKLDLNSTQAPTLKTVHQASPLIGPRIEGASIVRQPDGTQAILLHGFHSKNFMVWNETHQTQVMNVDCGGSHRSWMFSPDKTTGKGGLFAWTKTGAFVFYDQKATDHEIIQAGGHGREIKALATHQLDRHRWLLATGSEDTDIRLFEYNRKSSSNSGLKNIAVIRKHTTGLQDLQFSPDGKILISAAGIEEFCAWSLTPVPVIGQGVVFACSLSSTDAQSDARIMSFDMHVQHQKVDESNPSYLIVAAFSNGRLKTIRLNPATETTKAHFTLLHQLDFGTICLTQAFVSPSLTPESTPIISIVGATNGSIQICDILPSNDTLKTTISSLPQLKTSFNHKVHQNSITALQAHHLTPTHQLLVTGGDDNALAITIISTTTQPPIPISGSMSPHPSNTNATSNPTFTSLLIPNAHAAALTALQIIAHPHPLPSQPTTTFSIHKHFSILTAGNDQRLQLWDITIDTARLQSNSTTQTSSTLGEVQVEWLGEWYTDVADISAIDVLGGSGNGGTDTDVDVLDNMDGRGSVEVVIVGVGMEVIRLALSGNGDGEGCRCEC